MEKAVIDNGKIIPWWERSKTYRSMQHDVAGERELSKWADLVRTYILLKGQSIQYTVVSNEALKAAKIHPDKYRDLLMRTGGYSAFFVELYEETQDNIIARTEYQVY